LTHIKARSGTPRYLLRMGHKTLIASTEAQAIKLADASQTSPSGIVSRTVLQSPEVRVVLFTFADGQELTSHTSTRRAMVQILDGACDFFFAGQWQRLLAGTFLHLPPSHPHAVRAAAGPFSMLLTLGADASATPAESKS
jgi:quercetin dioxygenase-like cupin family protein